MDLKSIYLKNCEKASDINEHLPTLYKYARQCNHITEFGTRWGISTSALLYAQPKKLICYDISHRGRAIEELESLKGNTEFIFHKQNVLKTTIEPTELLFIDTWHAYIQLKQELAIHADKSSKYIILHDTEKFKLRGDDLKHTADPGGGLQAAIDEFLKTNSHWSIYRHYTNNNGLTVLIR